MALKANIIANFAGQAWRALMSLAFVPLYIKYLGIEAYGLIGIFATLQLCLSLLDLGLRPALGREMARFTAGAHDAQSIWDLLRSAEILTLCIAVLFAASVWAASGWLATDWVQVQRLPLSTVIQAFSIMGVVAALQLMESIYTSSMAGLQRQVLQNAIASTIATLRGFGAVAVLLWISPTIDAFFIWQGIVSVASVACFAVAVYRVIPLPARKARFSLEALLAIRQYAAGMVAITLLSLLLTQVDKVLLSRQLTLESFGHYVLAGAVAGTMSMLSTPIGTAYYPRLTALAARDDDGQMPAVYHEAAQLLTILMGAAAIMLIVFGDRLLVLWTRDPLLAVEVAPLLRIIVIGTLLNGLMNLPYLLQLAHGWTSLSIKINCAAVAILVPAILWVVPRYGAMGAASIWTLLNATYLFIGAHLMYRRLLTAEKWRWYLQDVGLPLAAAATTAVTCRLLVNFSSFSDLAEVIVLLGVGIIVVLTGALVSPFGRHSFLSKINTFRALLTFRRQPKKVI